MKPVLREKKEESAVADAAPAHAASNAQATAIDLRGLRKSFVTRTGTTLALEEVSLSVSTREFVCLIGPSGCGKSTILNLIAGVTKPDRGQVEINGMAPQDACRAHQIGFVFQDPVLLPWRTVTENVTLPLEILGMSGKERESRAQEILELVKLDGFERRFPHELSGGMRQRLGIGRALSFDPEILLMDEPFGALDAITRDKMTIELLGLWEQRQKTVVFVTHSINEAAFLSDRIVVMSPRPGRISTIIENPLPRPRPLRIRDDLQFINLSRQLRDLLEES